MQIDLDSAAGHRHRVRFVHSGPIARLCHKVEIAQHLCSVQSYVEHPLARRRILNFREFQRHLV
jgi:hypothetical protein